MLSKRAIVVTADKALAKRLGAGLMAAGATVETYPSEAEIPKGGELHADLVAMHVPEDAAILTAVIARLAEGARLVAIVPMPSIEATVNVMKHTRVNAVLVADGLDVAQVASVGSRLLHGDVFGLEKIVPWGVKVYSVLVGDYQEKSVAISAVSEFAEKLGVRRKYRDSIEQCLDEMLMNALYDAPVDTAGKQMFADIPTKTRISLRMEQRAVVQYACDGDTFALSVRDSFGALQGSTVVKYLDKCLHSEQQIDRKTGGAGLGLYIISNSATQFLVNLLPGVATEVICTFDLTAAKVQLKEFGVFDERVDASGRLIAGPSKLVGVRQSPGRRASDVGPSRSVLALLGSAVLLLLVLIGFVAYPRLKAVPRGSVTITSEPPGGTVEVDGVSRGTAPVTIPALVVGDRYKVTVRREGHEPSVDLVSPRDTGNTAVTVALRPLPATVVVKTTPPGATVVLGGQEVGTTPVTISTLAPGSEHEITLRRTGYTPVVEKLRVPEPGTRGEAAFALSVDANFGMVRFTTDPPGAEVLRNGDVLPGVKTPTDELIVQAGKKTTFTLRLDGYMPETKAVSVTPGQKLEPISVKLRAGAQVTISTNAFDARLTLGPCAGKGTVQCSLPDGTYRLTMLSTRPWISEARDIVVSGQNINRNVDLGWVETGPELALALPGAPKDTRRAAMSEGTRTISVVEADGKISPRTVRVVANRTVEVK
jgi:hypothetical protein